MGFPLSTFQQLSSLCREESFIKESFDRYRIVAVVVHGAGNNGFRRTMRDAFERLHETTGPRFAFITFVNPSEGWKREHSRWMRDTERLAAGDGCEDEAFFRALQDRLELPSSPSIVLTDNLLSDKYLILGTSEDRVVRQMEEIGRYVQQQEGRFPVTDRGFVDFLTTLGRVWSQKTKHGQPLAKDIADLVAVRALTGKGAWSDPLAVNKQRHDAQVYVRSELNALFCLLNDLRQSDPDEGAETALGRYSDYLAFVAREFSNLWIPTDGTPKYGKEWFDRYSTDKMDTEGMEPFSLNCLDNYNRLLPLFFGPGSRPHPADGGMERLMPHGFRMDFSPLGNFLGKAVEEEVNASVVQMIRSKLGVHIPEYYRLHDDTLGSGCPVDTQKKRVWFNNKGVPVDEMHFSDRTIPLGDLVYATRKLRDDWPVRMDFGLFGEEPYLNETYWFSQSRNKACHNSIYDERAFHETHDRFQGIMVRYLREMVLLKNSMI